MNVSSDISDEVIQMCYLIFNDILVSLISVFGVSANIMNIIIYIKLGTVDTSNLSFLVLSTSDLFTLIAGLLYNIFCFPIVNNIPDLTFEPLAIGYITAAWPRAVFSKMTCCVTVFITIERCLCIISPLKVKTILTTASTQSVLAILLVFCVLVNYMHVYTGSMYLQYNTRPPTNKSVLGLGFGANYLSVNEISGYLNTSTFTLLFFILICSTALLVYKLWQKSNWRGTLSCSRSSTFEELSRREKTVCVTVAVLAAFLVLAYLPYTINCILSAVVENGLENGKYNNTLQMFWIVSFTFETINSSTSIFVYYKMSSQYRKMFHIVLNFDKRQKH
ncbi:neuromedin-U receptor 2 [Biomphalaria glabrata]|nr:neuromedin-U receptor 2-like [Biomphalaria glabrata]